MTQLDKQLLMVRKLRKSLPSESSAYFYLSPMLNSKVMIRKNTYMCVESQRKTAKRLIKVAKSNPTLYTREDVLYAKLIKKANKRPKHENLS